jgi:hypothetical protein
MQIKKTTNKKYYAICGIGMTGNKVSLLSYIITHPKTTEKEVEDELMQLHNLPRDVIKRTY